MSVLSSLIPQQATNF